MIENHCQSCTEFHRACVYTVYVELYYTIRPLPASSRYISFVYQSSIFGSVRHFSLAELLMLYEAHYTVPTHHSHNIERIDGLH